MWFGVVGFGAMVGFVGVIGLGVTTVATLMDVCVLCVCSQQQLASQRGC